MPWREASTEALREEFVAMASQAGANVRALCRRYGISAKTGHKWLARHRAAGPGGLADRARRPHTSPGRTPAAMEARVLALRDAHPAWGGRKLRRRLRDLGLAGVPSASTITAILARHGRLDPAAGARHRPWQRFERGAPNELWQIDFKGHRPLATGGGTCHPLSVLDDHSRFLLGLAACADEREATVRAHLAALCRRYGLPWRILTDNGPPWGAAGRGGITALEAWLLRLGVEVRHGRPYHPQTRGKVERLHRTVEAEVGGDWRYPDLPACQAAFDRFRAAYNTERPHEALGLATPASRYQPSPRPFAEDPPPPDYGPGAIVRRVQGDGTLSYRGRAYRVGKGLRGQPVALRPTAEDGLLALYLGPARIGQLDLRSGAE
jgi:transposase InsO family protein